MCEREGERNFCNERLRRGKRKEERERDIYIVRMIQRKRDIFMPCDRPSGRPWSSLMPCQPGPSALTAVVFI